MKLIKIVFIDCLDMNHTASDSGERWYKSPQIRPPPTQNSSPETLHPTPGMAIL